MCYANALSVTPVEGEAHATHRVLRVIKNRFGSASEVAVLEMTSAGFHEVDNPSMLFVRPYAGNDQKVR